MTRALARRAGSAESRSLTTARAVLQALAFLAEHPEGVRAGQVATDLGKSVSTAYYLLSSLCEEGFAIHESKGLYRPAYGPGAPGPPTERAAPVPDDLSYAVDELFLRTHKRAYLGVVESGRIKIAAVRGRQGMPRVPGLGAEIRDSAHALALGKVVLARLGRKPLERYIGRGLRAFTARTITRPDALFAELEDVRRNGFAVDIEEFGEDFCCVAAPLLDGRRNFVGVIGVCSSARLFDAARLQLVEAVCEVARTPTPSAQTTGVDSSPPPPAASSPRAIPRAGAPPASHGRPGLQVDAEKHKVLALSDQEA